MEPQLRQLTKRTYLGVGYVHKFTNDLTGEIVVVPCTQLEYERLGGIDGALFNPVLEGHTWLVSLGGTDKVDTPSTLLGDNEYCVKDERVAMILTDESDSVYEDLPLEVVDAEDKIDTSRIKEYKTL